MAVNFRMTNTGRPEEEVPIVPVSHKCGKTTDQTDGPRIQVLPADRVWYLVLMQAYLCTWSRAGRGGTGHGVTGWW